MAGGKGHSVECSDERVGREPHQLPPEGAKQYFRKMLCV